MPKQPDILYVYTEGTSADLNKIDTYYHKRLYDKLKAENRKLKRMLKVAREEALAELTRIAQEDGDYGD
jgi:hypothetical protein